MAEVGEIQIKIVPEYSGMVEAFRQIAKCHLAMAAQAAQMADHFEAQAAERDEDGEQE